MTDSALLCVFLSRCAVTAVALRLWSMSCWRNETHSRWWIKSGFNLRNFDKTSNNTGWNAAVTEPLPCLTDSWNSLLYLSTDLHTYWQWFEPSRWFSVHLLCNLTSPFSFLQNGLMTANLPLRVFLIRLQWTVAERPVASLRSCVWSLLELFHIS